MEFFLGADPWRWSLASPTPKTTLKIKYVIKHKTLFSPIILSISDKNLTIYVEKPAILVEKRESQNLNPVVPTLTISFSSQVAPF